MPKYKITTESGAKYLITTEGIEKPANKKSIGEGLVEALPSVGQAAGGFAGATFNPVHPYIGGTMGGVMGRAAGERLASEYRANPVKALLKTFSPAAPGIENVVAGARQISPEETQKSMKSVIASAPTEAVSGVVGAGLGKVGTSFIKAFIPKTVAERGLRDGFKKLLNPEYYKEALPSDFVKRASNFFDTATERFGGDVSKAVSSARKNIDLNRIKMEAEKILPEGTTINDLELASDLQKKMMQRITDKIMNFKSPEGAVTANQIIKAGKASPKEIWELRRELDNLIYKNKIGWKPEALGYLKSLRNTLNTPLREASPNIEKAFDRFSYMQDAIDLVGGDFAKTIENRATGEIFSPGVEKFVKTLMRPDMEQTRNILKSIDPDLANQMFDVASAKVLGRQFIPQSPYQTLLGKLISPKMIARGAEVFQRPVVKGAKMVTGRGIPIAFTNIFSQQ